MKKFICLFMVIVLILSIDIQFNSSVSADSKDKINLSGVTYLNLPKKDFGGPIVTATLGISKFVLNKNKLKIEADLNYGGKSYPLSLAGDLHRSTVDFTDTRVGIVLEEVLGDFEVVHLSIDTNAYKGYLIDTSLAEKPVFSLYLLKKGTREATFFNADTTTFGSSIKSALNKEVQEAKERSKYAKKWDKIHYYSQDRNNAKKKEQYEVERLYINDSYNKMLFEPTILTSSDVGSTQLEGPNSTNCANMIACKDRAHYLVASYPSSGGPGCRENEIIGWSLNMNKPNRLEIRGYLTIEYDYSAYTSACTDDGSIKIKQGTSMTLRDLSSALQYVSPNPGSKPYISGDVFYSFRTNGTVTDDAKMSSTEVAVSLIELALDPTKMGALFTVLSLTSNFVKTYTFKSLSALQIYEIPYDASLKDQSKIENGHGQQLVRATLQGGRMGTVDQSWFIIGNRVENNSLSGKDAIYRVKFRVDSLISSGPGIKGIDTRELSTTCDYKNTDCAGADDRVNLIIPKAK